MTDAEKKMRDELIEDIKQARFLDCVVTFDKGDVLTARHLCLTSGAESENDNLKVAALRYTATKHYLREAIS